MVFKKKQLPAVIPKDADLIVPTDPEQLEECKRYFSKRADLSSYKKQREHMEWIDFALTHGVFDTKIANTKAYLMSMTIIAYDRERQHEGIPANTLNDLVDENGQINLTEEQMALVTQQPNLAVQAGLIERFVKENTKSGQPVLVEVEDIVEGNRERTAAEMVKDVKEKSFSGDDDGYAL